MSKMTHDVNSRPSPRGGVGLFAVCKIPPGQLVVDIPDPLVIVPDDARLEECCSWCVVWRPKDGISPMSMLNPYRDENPLSYCVGCRVVKYCSKVCLCKSCQSSLLLGNGVDFMFLGVPKGRLEISAQAGMQHFQESQPADPAGVCEGYSSNAVNGPRGCVGSDPPARES